MTRTTVAGPRAAGEPSPLAPALIAWHARYGRHHLPWQRERSLYRVWISEIMLQQTQVASVLPYFTRFMTRFPDARTLANAPIDEVLHLWSGLGYYARARNLHRAAQRIRDELGGHFPRERTVLERLPGIGRSTAGAILALSLGERHAILDGNAKRVLARYFAIGGDPTNPATLARLWERAEQCTPSTDVAVYTQAIMDLGATVCTRSRPHCSACPLANACEAHLSGRTQELPGRRIPRARPARATFVLLAVSDEGRVLLERRPPRGIWGGLWSPPQFPTRADARKFIPQAIALACGESLAFDLEVEPAALAPLRHAFTHFDLTLHPLVISCPVRRVHDRLVPCVRSMPQGEPWLWYDPREPSPIGLPAPIAQLIETVHDRHFLRQTNEVSA